MLIIPREKWDLYQKLLDQEKKVEREIQKYNKIIVDGFVYNYNARYINAQNPCTINEMVTTECLEAQLKHNEFLCRDLEERSFMKHSPRINSHIDKIQRDMKKLKKEIERRKLK